MTLKNKNYWHVYKSSLITWEINLPTPQNENDLERIYSFTEAVLQAGIEHRIYRVLEVTNPYIIPDEPQSQDFVSIMRHTYEQTGILCFFWAMRVGQNQILGEGGRVASVVCHYDAEGEIAETECSDLGSLIMSLRLDLVRYAEERGWHPMKYSMYHYPPVMLQGSQYRKERFTDKTQRPEYIYLRIETPTDIWLPFVLSRESDDDDERVGDPVSGYFDNRELALCHVFRFNDFIQACKQITLAYGGTWRLDSKPGSPKYSQYITEDGIDLDDAF